MRINAFSTLAFGLGLGLAGAQLVACSNSSEDCNATATCGGAGSSSGGSAGKSGGGSGNEGGDGAGTNSGGSQGTSGTSGGGGEGGGAGSACVGDVADDAACWTTNELGVFVSSDTGDDATGDGTREKPFASISQGIASAAGKNVYVCLGAADAYAEKLTITDTEGDGVHLYGGFECDNWTHDVARYVTVESPEPIALRIQSLKTGVHIENVRFFAANGAGADESSYGAFITQSKGVVLRRVEISAGDGLKGADGDPGTKGADGSEAGTPPIGQPADCTAPPTNLPGGTWGAENSCGSLGGKGGDASKVGGADGVDGAPIEHVNPLNGVENGGPGASDAQDGENGSKGMSGDAGALAEAAGAAGTLSIQGFAPASGKAGSEGFTGQGGGGGGASKGSGSCVGASGGAGGMGGCGGTAGKGGQGGGASVGLLSWNSEVTLVDCTVESGTGGGGGAGGKGGGPGLGALGGDGGNPLADGTNTIARGGQGGPGGNGGNGGSGSGGTGGPSYAIAYFGTKPVYEAADTTLTPGAGGDPGIGGELLTKAPNGSAGDSTEEFQVP